LVECIASDFDESPASPRFLSPLSFVFGIEKGVGAVVDSGGNGETDVLFNDSTSFFGFDENRDGGFDVFDVTPSADVFMLADGLTESSRGLSGIWDCWEREDVRVVWSRLMISRFACTFSGVVPITANFSRALLETVTSFKSPGNEKERLFVRF